MTYMRQWGHPASTIEVASGLLDFCSPSDDTHELVGDIDGEDQESLSSSSSSSSSSSITALVDGPPLALICFADRFSFRSTFGYRGQATSISNLKLAFAAGELDGLLNFPITLRDVILEQF
ncbi:hypothetical protein MUK42_36880 [Musa troglodytarum]|uniref:Uncharacterized protein n=1 Tax=Musa troglodytarum TaxID=320322 RepID=A0A9E7HEY9_9LILI|nr:hypothetical protein MUK42_36880 [Musa troglodytarum]